MTPAVVVIAYDRPSSLERLLRSLAAATYSSSSVPLIISVDASCSGTLRVAREFAYAHGPKTVIPRATHLGLVAHVLACADLVNEHGSVIVLEDDLVVSPHFHGWATKALQFYADDPSIGGISLYRYAMAEVCPAPFEPLDDGSDVHFIQFASSWGQAWTREQWAGFREWDGTHTAEEKESVLPGFVQGWVGPSWKRRFIAYLVATSKYFVFPPASLTTNFGDPGTNADTPGLYQVSLERRARDYRFALLSDSQSVYDAYFELTPGCLNRWTDALRVFDYDIDLYGRKSPQHLRSEFVLTTRRVRSAEREYGLAMTPNIANVIEGIRGAGIRLARCVDAEPGQTPSVVHHYPLASVVESVFGRRVAPESEPEALPYLSLVTVETAPGEAASVRQSVSAQRYPSSESVPSVEHVMVVSHAGSDHSLHLWGGPRVVPLTRPTNGPPDATVLWALEQARGEVIGCAPPGTALVPGALFEVESIFRSLPGVSWLASLPGRAHAAPGDAMRDRPEQVMDAARRFDLDWGGVFWRRKLWDQAVAGATPPRSRSELWARMAEEAPLQLALHTFLFSTSIEAVAPSRVLDGGSATTPRLPKNANESPDCAGNAEPPTGGGSVPFPRPARSLSHFRRFLRWTTEPFFRRDVSSLNFLHTATHLAPYIAIWDSATGSIALWHYPPDRGVNRR